LLEKIGFHTDAFNSSYWSFGHCLEWAGRQNLGFIECGAIDGVSWIHGLGYQPHVALWEDPVLLRRKMDAMGIAFSQIDAAFPLSLPEGATLGVEYVLNTIRWAKLAGCPSVDTTDARTRPEGLTDREGLELMRQCYRRIVPVAEAYGIIINVEPHGYYTTDPEFMAEILGFVDSPCLRMNMDTGNTFIAGQDPVGFLRAFRHRISHVHIKDVSESLAASSRGGLTGIAVSHCAIGDGVNAQNIRESINILIAGGYQGVFSIECEGQGGPMIERSLDWVRHAVTDAEAAVGASA
jgi:sugar phosphate isomerase/epimerase